MQHEIESNRKLSKMTIAVTIVLFVLLVCMVYSADFTTIINDSISYATLSTSETHEDSQRTHICENSCNGKRLDQNRHGQQITLETCNMLCGELPLWPKPTKTVVTARDRSSFSKNRLAIKLDAPEKIKQDLKEATNIFIKNLPPSDDIWIDDKDSLVNIYINVSSDESLLKLSTSEQYDIAVNKIRDIVNVNITARTYFGARHGLETLSQLIWLDTSANKLNIVHDVNITDEPKFAYRGLMVDTARNYFYVDQLKKVLDGMASTKLNVLHLHLTDAVSFPIVLPRNELFAKYGAYSPQMVYTPEDIKDLIKYARIRGIRVILEVDAPSHVSENLNEAVDNLVICAEDSVFDGHLNPSNNKTFEVLTDIYKDLLDMGTDTEIFHIGVDEVNLKCWQRFLTYDRHRKLESVQIWINFTNKMVQALMTASEKSPPKYTVIWSSDLTSHHMKQIKNKENIIVQYWYGSIFPILENGNKVILSTVGHWYLDCGYGSWSTKRDEGVCDPYTTWHKFYQYRPWMNEFRSYKDQILGGEACLWSELVEVDSLETRIWPRTAAFAERLWRDPQIFDRDDVYRRLAIHRERLTYRGIKSEAIWPRWCTRHPGRC